MEATFNASFSEQSESLTASFGNVQMVHTDDYNDLINKPSIEGVTLQGDKSFRELGMDTLSVQDIEKILYLD